MPPLLPRSLFGLPDKASLGCCNPGSPAWNVLLLFKRPFCSLGPILNATSSENFVDCPVWKKLSQPISHSLEPASSELSSQLQPARVPRVCVFCCLVWKPQEEALCLSSSLPQPTCLAQVALNTSSAKWALNKRSTSDGSAETHNWPLFANMWGSSVCTN